MKLGRILIFFIIIGSILIGCMPRESGNNGETILSDQLIYVLPDNYDKVTLNVDDRGTSNDSETIQDLINELKGIKLRKLNVEEERKLFLETPATANIWLLSENSTIPKIANIQVGGVMIFSTGEIVFPDVKTMFGAERTVTYVNVKEDKKRIERIIHIIESTKFNSQG